MATTWTDVNGRNWPVCSCLKAWLPAYQNELLRAGVIKRGLDVYQAIGGAAASAGYHSKGGNVDVGQVSSTAIRIARNMGGASFGRGPADGMVVHNHIALKGCPHMVYGPRWQVTDLEAGNNGLARRARGRDKGPRSGVHWPLRTYKQGIAWAKANAKPDAKMRFATFNLPGPDKISNSAARIKVGVKQVKAANVALVGWNELEGIKKQHIASDFAHDVDAELGAGWNLIKPTLSLNENYISYRTSLFKLVEQYPDTVLPSPTGGRHLTSARFEDKATGLEVVVGQSHLVNDGGAQGRKDRQAQAKKAHDILSARAKDADCPYIFQADANTSDALSSFVSAKAKRTRTYADESKSRDTATFTAYTKTTPSKDKALVMDQQYVAPSFYVVGYSVTWGTRLGRFTKPRASDHALVVSSVTHVVK